MSRIKRRLSQTLGAIRKGWVVDTKEGGFPISQVMANVAAASATSVHSAITLPATGTTEVSTGITNPGHYRCLSVTGNAVGIYASIIVYGKDWADRSIHETIVASGNTTINGNFAFKSVEKIVVGARTTAGDTVSVGVSDKLGLYRPLKGAVAGSFVQLLRKATAADEYSVEGTGPTVSTTYDTILPNGGITGNDSFRAEYLTDIF